MSRAAIALTALLMAFGARAETLAEKVCIFTAAEKLPPIPGLVITASRMKDVPPEMQQKPGVSSRIVEIDVKAAGQDATFAFVCATTGNATVATPFGISR
jgi:hypothetical protein